MPIQRVVIEGNNVEEAIQEGLKRLGKDKSETSIEIIQEGKAGLFERENQKAKVRMTAEGTDLKQLLERTIRTMMRLLGIRSYSLDINIREDFYSVDITAEDDLSVVIGEEGQTLNAIQHLAEKSLTRRSDEPVHVVLDAGGYREYRRKELEERAQNAIERTLREQAEVELTPMIPYERKIIHDEVRKHEGVKSHSIGEDTNRRVVILPKGMA